MDTRKLANFDEFMKEIAQTKPGDFCKIYTREGDNLRLVIKAAIAEKRNPLNEFFSRSFRCKDDNKGLIEFLAQDPNFFPDILQTGAQVIATCFQLYPQERVVILKAIESKLSSMEFSAIDAERLKGWREAINNQTPGALSTAPSANAKSGSAGIGSNPPVPPYYRLGGY